MKIIQIGPYPLEEFIIQGGIEASVYGLSKQLAKNHKVFVIDIPRKDIKKDIIAKQNGTIIFRFSNKIRKNIFSSLKIIKILKIIIHIKPDICHIHSTSFFSFLLYIFLKIKKKVVIVTVHGLAHVEKEKLWKNKKTINNFLKLTFQSLIEIIFLSLCKKVIVDSEYVCLEIKKNNFNVPTCLIIPQGIDPVFFQLNSSKQNQNQLLAIGAFNERKGHKYLIDIMKILVKQFPELKLYIAGTSSDNLYFELIKNKIIENNLEKHIFLFPNASQQKIFELYTTCGIFVLHTQEESQGIVFCEAMAVGLPIVTTNVGGVPFIVKDKENGFLTEFSNIISFAKNIEKLLINDEKRKEISLKNKTEALKYNWESIAKQIIKVYLDELYKLNKFAKVEKF